MKEPWVCPKCNTVYAPWVDRCQCNYKVAELRTDYTPSADFQMCMFCGICGGHRGDCIYKLVTASPQK